MGLERQFTVVKPRRPMEPALIKSVSKNSMKAKLPPNIRSKLYEFLTLGTLIHKTSKIARRDQVTLFRTDVLDQYRPLLITQFDKIDVN